MSDERQPYLANGSQTKKSEDTGRGKATGDRMMEAMNYIDDDLILESTRPIRKKKGFRIPSAAVAGICLMIGAGTLLGGGTILSQQQKMREMQDQLQAMNAEAMPATAEENEEANEAIAAEFAVKKDYGEIYDAMRERGALLSDLREKQSFWSQIFPGGGGKDMIYDGDVVYEEAAVSDEAPAEAVEEKAEVPAAASAGGDYSRTNLMTEGVDESDIVKTDGKFIYMVQSGSVKIVDIRGGVPGASAHVNVPFEAPSDIIREMYVDGTQMVIITSHDERIDDSQRQKLGYGGSRRYRQETFAYVYDLSTPIDAKLVGCMKQDGSYRTSRKKGDLVYLFTDQTLILPEISRKEALESNNLRQWFPAVNDEMIVPEHCWISRSGYQSLVISSFDVKAPEKVLDAKVITDDYPEIYVGSDHIYLYSTDWTSTHQITALTSFSYQDGKIRAGSTTTLAGMIRDSFAIHEKGENLCVLTTDQNGSSVNTLYVLDSELQLTGRIDEIARGEEIYAARYIGDMAYFITYHNTDPLFCADLSDPYDPKLLGSLEITGFSDYLHPWDANHVLGMGYETDEDSNRLGIKLVMFDVSDPMNPVIENTRVLRCGNRKYQDNSACGPDEYELSGWYDSAAISGQYKALLVDPSKNLIGFGMSYYNWRSTDPDEHTYRVFSYTKENGFEEEMGTALRSQNESEYRGLYSGDWFYIAGSGTVDAYNMKKNFRPET